VRVERHGDVTAFLARAGGFLVEREAEHNLILGLSSTLARDPLAYGSEPYLVTVESGGRVVAAALRTPPYNLVLSESDEEGVWPALAADAAGADASLGGVLGPVGGVGSFVDAWRRLTGATASRSRSQRVYRISDVAAVDDAPGTMRAYEEGDRPLVLAWLEAFFEEEFGSQGVESAERTLEHRLSDPHGGVMLWYDGRPVSLAGFGGPTPGGVRIGPVYTPPELRRRGYATALTAELSRSLLAGGRRFCFLFTDLANPTSNAIYMRIGYRPVTDVEEWRFEASS
jgi:predicted GNAT family acetyltransferase